MKMRTLKEGWLSKGSFLPLIQVRHWIIFLLILTMVWLHWEPPKEVSNVGAQVWENSPVVQFPDKYPNFGALQKLVWWEIWIFQY